MNRKYFYLFFAILPILLAIPSFLINFEVLLYNRELNFYSAIFLTALPAYLPIFVFTLIWYWKKSVEKVNRFLPLIPLLTGFSFILEFALLGVSLQELDALPVLFSIALAVGYAYLLFFYIIRYCFERLKLLKD